jgi:hypothetical protein
MCVIIILKFWAAQLETSGGKFSLDISKFLDQNLDENDILKWRLSITSIPNVVWGW